MWSVIDHGDRVEDHRLQHLHLVDNFGVGLSLARGRAKSFAYLQQCRRVAAVSLACSIQIGWRWVPTEVHPADPPSRYFEKSHVEQQQVYQKGARSSQASTSRRAVGALSRAKADAELLNKLSKAAGLIGGDGSEEEGATVPTYSRRPPCGRQGPTSCAAARQGRDFGEKGDT